MARLQHTGFVFFFHLMLFGGVSAVLFALTHRPVATADATGLLLGVLAWSFTAALENRIQPNRPATVHAEDSPWRMLALAMLQLTLPIAAVSARFERLSLGLGAALLAVGGGLRLWSLRALGQHFTWTTGIIAEHRVVRDGPYRFFRHPNYTGSVLFAAGIALAAGSPWALAPVAVMAGAVVVTARHEEAYLRVHLPEYK